MAGSHNRKKTTVRLEFGKQVRERRLKLNLTQEELAEQAGLHPTYVGSVERGERNVALENIVKLAKAMHCEAAKLLDKL